MPVKLLQLNLTYCAQTLISIRQVTLVQLPLRNDTYTLASGIKTRHDTIVSKEFQQISPVHGANNMYDTYSISHKSPQLQLKFIHNQH